MFAFRLFTKGNRREVKIDRDHVSMDFNSLERTRRFVKLIERRNISFLMKTILLISTLTVFLGCTANRPTAANASDVVPSQTQAAPQVPASANSARHQAD